MVQRTTKEKDARAENFQSTHLFSCLTIEDEMSDEGKCDSLSVSRPKRSNAQSRLSLDQNPRVEARAYRPRGQVPTTSQRQQGRAASMM